MAADGFGRMAADGFGRVSVDRCRKRGELVYRGTGWYLTVT